MECGQIARSDESKAELLYLLRFDTNHDDYKKVSVEVPNAGMPLLELMKLITKTLPGWQSTRFPSHMILYMKKREYAQGTVILRATSKGVKLNSVRSNSQVFLLVTNLVKADGQFGTPASVCCRNC